MIDERSRRVGESAKGSGADWVILTSPDSICYASDHEVPIETGPLPSAGGPSCAFVGTDGSVALVVVNAEEKAARASNATVVRSYEGYSYKHQAPAKDNYVGTVLGLASELGVGGVIAVEPVSFPASLREALGSAVSAFVDITPELTRARATKTAYELDRLRYCAELTGVGQRAALKSSLAGRRQLEVLADIRCAMELSYGKRLPIIHDFLTGAEDTAQMTGIPPSPRVIKQGEPVICDLAPRAHGYWGDSCTTFFTGQATADFRRLYDLCRAALEHAVETLRPGITAGQFDAGVRATLQKADLNYAHHTGHGIGTAVHEFPLLVPDERAVLEPDMVLLVEPGVYVPGLGGVRLEWMFRVTDDGNEVMSPYEHTLQIAGH